MSLDSPDGLLKDISETTFCEYLGRDELIGNVALEVKPAVLMSEAESLEVKPATLISEASPVKHEADPLNMNPRPLNMKLNP
ncbi:hypothetical protein Mpet_1679 [Methanolacinia petrolearia DSM 11571]|uniref:Uncharacterized protein n=1 Tax=Methanolacinia petrolearia (strain DSM 11571 / OCM 486 / SEBR 4847) TaxID=679926 RepID=E1RHC8_METP4|nr:hypothetical protein [Methanolacinia petrolearia]ADN36432.1 hypothetical protein Mpet_1679 [Methanolacinia petrolearia DSM 11571]